MNTVIFIDEDGNMSGLADDVLDKLNLGKKEINRVSDIEWDHIEEVWVARDVATGDVIAKNSIRSNCILAEREFLNKKIRTSFLNK